MNERKGKALIFAVVLTATLAGCSDTPEPKPTQPAGQFENNTNTGTTNNQLDNDWVETEGCDSIRVQDDGSVSWNGCEREVGTGEDWACRCDGTEASAPADRTCEDALVETCSVTQADTDSCSFDDLGACRPDADGGFECFCGSPEVSQDIAAEGCLDTLWAECSEGCTVDEAECVPGDELESYDCYCPYYETSRTTYSRSCESAANKCVPRTNGCSQYSGFCDDGVVDGEYLYDCHCVDGTSGTRTPEELGGTDDCELALDAVCGTETPDGLECEREVDPDRTVSCTAVNGDKSRWSCECKFVDPNGMNAAVGGNEIEASDCEAAMDLMNCP